MNEYSALIIFLMGCVCGICWTIIYEIFTRAYRKVRNEQA